MAYRQIIYTKAVKDVIKDLKEASNNDIFDEKQLEPTQKVLFSTLLDSIYNGIDKLEKIHEKMSGG